MQDWNGDGNGRPVDEHWIETGPGAARESRVVPETETETGTGKETRAGSGRAKK